MVYRAIPVLHYHALEEEKTDDVDGGFLPPAGWNYFPSLALGHHPVWPSSLDKDVGVWGRTNQLVGGGEHLRSVQLDLGRSHCY